MELGSLMSPALADRFFTTNAVWEAQRILLIKENLISQVWRTGKPGMLQSMGLQRVGQDWATEQQQQKDISRNLALFYVWEDARGWALWNHSFHMHFSYLGLVSCVFHILLQFLSVHHKEWLQPNGCQIAGTVLLLGLTPGSKIHTGRAGITDDYDILVYWYSFIRVCEGPQ